MSTSQLPANEKITTGRLLMIFIAVSPHGVTQCDDKREGALVTINTMRVSYVCRGLVLNGCGLTTYVCLNL